MLFSPVPQDHFEAKGSLVLAKPARFLRECSSKKRPLPTTKSSTLARLRKRICTGEARIGLSCLRVRTARLRREGSSQSTINLLLDGTFTNASFRPNGGSLASRSMAPLAYESATSSKRIRNTDTSSIDIFVANLMSLECRWLPL